VSQKNVHLQEGKSAYKQTVFLGHMVDSLQSIPKNLRRIFVETLMEKSQSYQRNFPEWIEDHALTLIPSWMELTAPI